MATASPSNHRPALLWRSSCGRHFCTEILGGNMSIGLGTKTSPIEPEEGKPVKPLTPDDEGYVEEVYRRTQTPVRRHCTHLTGSPPDGEDLCHDSYVDFMVGRVQKQGRIEQERELPYLKTTAT